MKTKSLLIKLLTGLVAGGSSFGIAMGVLEKQYKEDYQKRLDEQQINIDDFIDDEVPLTNKEKFLTQAMDIKAVSIEGFIGVSTPSNTNFDLDVGLKVKIPSYTDISFGANFALNMDEVNVPFSISYFNSVVYMDYRQNHFKLALINIRDAIGMLKTLALDIGLNIDFDLSSINFESFLGGAEGGLDLISLINKMTDKVESNGDITFSLDLNEDISVSVITNSDCVIKGVKLNKCSFKGVNFSGELSVTPSTFESLGLKSPQELGIADQYHTFENSYNLISGLVHTFGNKQNTVNLIANVTRKDDTTVSVLNTDLDISYDIEKMNFTFEGSVNENNRQHLLKAGYVDNNVFANYNDLKVKLNKDSIAYLMEFVTSRVGSNNYKDVLSEMSDTLQNIDVKSLVALIDKYGSNLVLEEGCVALPIDTSDFNLEFGTFTPVIHFDKDKIIDIEIKGFKYNEYSVDIKLKLLEYNAVTFNKDEYVSLDPVLSLKDAALDLIKQRAFNVNFSTKVQQIEENKEYSVSGNGQFDIEKKLGYGTINFVDSNKKLYKVAADVSETGLVLFEYNDLLKGKFTFDTVKDTVSRIKQFTESRGMNNDVSVDELKENLTNALVETPIYSILKSRDYLALSEYNILNSLSINEDRISLNLALDILGYHDKNISLDILYSSDNGGSIDGIIASIKDFSGLNIDFEIHIDKYNNALESQRMNPNDKYFDFTDLDVLVDMGLNTLDFSYFHFGTAVNVIIPVDALSTTIEMNISIDLKIRVDNNKLQVAGEVANIPLINVGPLQLSGNPDYAQTLSRSGSFYYSDGLFYLKRVDICNELSYKYGFLPVYTKRSITYSEVCDVEYVKNNIARIIMNDFLGVSTTLTDLVIKDGGLEFNKDVSNIKFESLFKDFNIDLIHHKTSIGLDISEVMDNDKITSIDITIGSSNDNSQINSLNINTVLNLLVPVTIKANLSVANRGIADSSNHLTNLENWMNYCSNTTKNSLIKRSVQ